MANPRATTFIITLSGNGSSRVDFTMEHDTTADAAFGGNGRGVVRGSYAFSALANPALVRNQLVDAAKASLGFVGTVDA